MNKKCGRLGCISPAVAKGYCSLHAPNTTKADPPHRYDYSAISDAANGIYSTSKWRAMRRLHLNRNPLCDCCGFYGVTRVAVDVDHVIPHRGSVALFNDKANLSSLCKSCHSSKTGSEKKGLVLDYRNNCKYDLSGSFKPIDSSRDWDPKPMQSSLSL